jgi:tryptophan synthase alpha chain
VIARARASTEVPVAVGFGISTPQQASAAARAGADGVIIGTRLVRAAADGPDPASAAGALVREFSLALR